MPQSAFEPLLEFNTAFIKQQKIKSITFDILDKKDFEAPVDRNLMHFYEFDTSGLLKRFYYTNIVKTIEKEYHSPPVYRHRRLISNGSVYFKNEYVYDTISTIYMYKNNNLILKRYNDGTYYESRYYNYDAKNRLTKERRVKETNLSSDKSNFILGNQTVISEDSFQYLDITPHQFKQICLNSENRPYKEIIINTDSAGNMVSKNESYIVAWIVQNTIYTYEKNQLTSATFKGNANGDVILKTTYERDTMHCIYTEKQYKNDVLLKELSYITDRANRCLNSFIVRDPINKNMRIVKLFYMTYHSLVSEKR
ncbi:MAG TPA: hypothetical protein VN026_14405 [Bacteroidia bacterium]|jgi:hypothetical protein|nr:hypothetical protein [Bacteroidia bacterium]